MCGDVMKIIREPDEIRFQFILFGKFVFSIGFSNELYYTEDLDGFKGYHWLHLGHVVKDGFISVDICLLFVQINLAWIRLV